MDTLTKLVAGGMTEKRARQALGLHPGHRLSMPSCRRCGRRKKSYEGPHCPSCAAKAGWERRKAEG